jgi:hypothetical protein
MSNLPIALRPLAASLIALLLLSSLAYEPVVEK